MNAKIVNCKFNLKKKRSKDLWEIYFLLLVPDFEVINVFRVMTLIWRFSSLLDRTFPFLYELCIANFNSLLFKGCV